jgi:hypothetical protein
MASRNVLGDRSRTSYTVSAAAPIDYNMSKGVYGSYGGLVLKPPGNSSWKAYPDETPLLKNPIFVPQGAGVPLKNEEVPVNIPNDSMFVFAKNRSSPYCKSSFSTSTGQVCTTKEQRDLIGLNRGQNKSYPGSNPDF